MARVPYLDPADLPEARRELLETSMARDDLPEEYRHLLDAEARNVHRALAHAPDGLAAFRRALHALWAGLSPRRRELVILAVAAEVGSAYEWHQHVRHALAVGFDPEEIRAVGAGAFGAFDPAETALLAYVSAYAEGGVADRHHDALAEHVDDATVVGVAMLAGAYLGLARTIDALEIEPEGEFVGWDLEGL